MRKLFRILGVLLAVTALALGAVIIYAHITYYSPPDTMRIATNKHPDVLSDTAVVSLLTWNLGYAGLGDDMDFFYDGGRQVRTDRGRTLTNLRAILQFIDAHRDTDFFLFQEVDRDSRRSYHIDMKDSIARTIPDAHHHYAKNYDVRFVPVPWYSPMGRVSSGLMSAGTHTPALVERVSYPGDYPWPDKLFSLQRCLLLQRYAVSGGRELVVINTHNSAFDDGGLRKKQMAFLREIMVAEYASGNYVIAGGDFNQCPPGFEQDFLFNVFDSEDFMLMPDDFLPGWHFVYDPTVPTNRRVLAPYDPNSTKTTLIDFFIASPNVHPVSVQGVHLDFRHSDHNPVRADFQLTGSGFTPPAENRDR